MIRNVLAVLRCCMPVKQLRMMRSQFAPIASAVPTVIRRCYKFRFKLTHDPRALASSADPAEVEYDTQLLEVEDLLEGATSKGDAELSKPSPEIFRAAPDRVGTDERFTFVVGDTPYDVLAAHRVPLPIAAVLCGGFERELLIKAEFMFNDVQHMLREIDRIDDYFDD